MREELKSREFLRIEEELIMKEGKLNEVNFLFSVEGGDNIINFKIKIRRR